MEKTTQPKVSMGKAILDGRCPVCREGAVFKNPILSVDFLSHNENCAVCGTHYEVEPGFFWGAMYFNYAFNIAMMAIMGIILYFGFHVQNPYAYIAAMITPILLTIPLTARLSRMLWIYTFGPFKYRGQSTSTGSR
jgi:uncharacterized protein (DUF983 family)